MAKSKKITELLSPRRLFDLLVGALEGGSNYWYYLPDLSMIPAKDYTSSYPEIEDYLKDCTVSRIWEAVRNGETIPVYDAENEDEMLGVFNLETINRGTELMLKDYSDDFANVLSEQDDANTADTWFQLCVMGELIFS